MKITTPQDLTHTIESAVKKFEWEIKSVAKDQDQYDIRVLGEFSKEIRKGVEKEYKGAGWRKAKCISAPGMGGPGSSTLKLMR